MLWSVPTARTVISYPFYLGLIRHWHTALGNLNVETNAIHFRDDRHGPMGLGGLRRLNLITIFMWIFSRPVEPKSRKMQARFRNVLHIEGMDRLDESFREATFEAKANLIFL